MKPLEGAGVANLQTLFAFPGGFSHFASRGVSVYTLQTCVLCTHVQTSPAAGGRQASPSPVVLCLIFVPKMW